jgi:hypothetical protein
VKPDWKDAPEWANYLAMDEDGEWYWHEYEPLLVGSIWSALTGRIQYTFPSPPPWWETKETRPTKENSPC